MKTKPLAAHALRTLLACVFTAALAPNARADVFLSGGDLRLIEEGGTIGAGNLAAGGTAFAKDGANPALISLLNDQEFGNAWLIFGPNNFAGISFGATPVLINTFAFGRDNTGMTTDHTTGIYTLQYTTAANPSATTPDASWTNIGTLDYQSAGGTNFDFPSRRHVYTFNMVSATGIRLRAPFSASIDELEVYGPESSIPRLSELTLSSGTLSPVFAADVTYYTADVANDVTSVTVTVVPEDDNTSYYVMGGDLVVGPNDLYVVIHGQYGGFNMYTLTVTRAPSSNADLAGLTLSSGMFSPTFVAATTEYTASVINATTSLTVTPTLGDNTATVKVNGTTIASGTASQAIALSVGDNLITTLVTAQDTTTTKAYTVTVNRAPSNNANLLDLTLSSGTLSPIFSPDVTNYTTSVGNDVTMLTMTPVTENSAATFQITGGSNLIVGHNIVSVNVSAEDGTTKKTYTVTVDRAPPILTNFTILDEYTDDVPTGTQYARLQIYDQYVDSDSIDASPFVFNKTTPHEGGILFYGSMELISGEEANTFRLTSTTGKFDLNSFDCWLEVMGVGRDPESETYFDPVATLVVTSSTGQHFEVSEWHWGSVDLNWTGLEWVDFTSRNAKAHTSNFSLATLAAGQPRTGIELNGGGLALVEEGGNIAADNLAVGATPFAKDVYPHELHTIPHLNDQIFGNSYSWIGNSTSSFAGINLGVIPVCIGSIAFGRDSTGEYTDRTFGTYTLQYTTVANPSAATADGSWTTIGTLNYRFARGVNFSSPSKRHRFRIDPILATGVRILTPIDTCIDELEIYCSPENNNAPAFSGFTGSTAWQTAASVSCAKILSKASDSDGDALNITSAGLSSAGGGSAVLSGASILYTPASAFSGTDTFQITITDARGASVQGVVTMNVGVPPDGGGQGGNPPRLTMLPEGKIGIAFQGIPGRSYQIQRSTNLAGWTPIATVPAAENGAVEFIDENPPEGSGFYRLRKP